MITTRNVYRWFLAIAFAAFAVPALAAPVKKYTLDVSPTIVSSPLQQVTVLINNVSTGGNSNINSMKVYLPEGYTLKVEPLPSTYRVTHDWTSIGSISATDGGNVIGLSAMSPLRPTNKFNLKFWVNVPACGTQSNWATAATGPTAFNGTDFNGDTFTLVPGNNVTTTVGGSPSMAFDPTNPTSTLKDTDVVLKVNLFDGCSAPANGTVTLGSTPLAFTGTASQATVSGVATFTVKFADLGATTLSATAAGYGAAPTASLTVFDGILGCTSETADALALPTSGEGTSHQLPAGDALGDPGFVYVVRSYDPDKGSCSATTKLNYSVVNHISASDDADPLTDPLNNNVWPGFYSLTWDANQVDSSGNPLLPIIAVVATYRPEWGDAVTGLPTRKTLICTATPCTAAPYTADPDTGELTVINTSGGWKLAVACLSSLVLHSSIPKINPTTFEPGCLVSERWDLVNDDDPDYCTGTGPGSTPRCLKPIAIMLMGQDPIWGR